MSLVTDYTALYTILDGSAYPVYTQNPKYIEAVEGIYLTVNAINPQTLVMSSRNIVPQYAIILVATDELSLHTMIDAVLALLLANDYTEIQAIRQEPETEYLAYAFNLIFSTQ